MHEPQFVSKRALLVGEALIDIVVPQAGEITEHVGGSPANAAIGVARLGHAAYLLTQLGPDARGERIASHLENDGVILHERSWRSTPTSTALARIGADGAADYEFNFEWDIPAVSAVDADLVFVGSLGLFVAPGGCRAIDLLRGTHGRVITAIDPNIRASLLPEHATVLEQFEQAAGLSNLVKLSDEDAAWLYPDREIDEVAAALLQLGVQIVVVTLGAAGALAYTRRQRVSVPAAPTVVVDTISAGDSLMASLLASLLELGVDGVVAALPEVLQRAVCAAAIAVSEAGANPPSRAALDAKFAAVVAG